MRIEDYALIGNMHSAALVGRDGSIDWMCLPRFDSPACFSALLGTREHGFWRIAPRGPYKSTRRYRPGSMVLETEFETSSGRVRVVDCMTPAPGADLVRLVEGIEGHVPMTSELVLRLDYGSHVPRIRYEAGAIVAVGGPDSLRVHAPVEFEGDNRKSLASFTAGKGEQIPFVLDRHASHDPDPAPIRNPAQLVARATRRMQAWSGQSTYQGPWKEVVDRSLLTLKALTYLPTGGIVAAPTTSLPELIGGVRNWDYRYCWLRDASLTLYAFMSAGYREEAKAWREWLLRAAAGSPADIRIMYGLHGERRLPESELSWLPGYEESRPVRVGNAAADQFQLDVYGEVIGLLDVARRGHLGSLEESWPMQREIIEHVARVWDRPDEGIWEVRGPRRHFTHSKLMAWLALDRGIKAIEEFSFPGSARRWRALRDRIHREICTEGFNSKTGTFVQYFGGTSLDASLLTIPMIGFLPVDDPRVRSTVDAIERTLVHNGFVMRYLPEGRQVDGLPAGEGAFLACSFWLVDVMLLQGRRREAEALFERLISIRNDVGLLAEEYDPVERRQLGNFPQAFSHVSLINSAFGLWRASLAATEADSTPRPLAKPPRGKRTAR